MESRELEQSVFVFSKFDSDRTQTYKTRIEQKDLEDAADMKRAKNRQRRASKEAEIKEKKGMKHPNVCRRQYDKNEFLKANIAYPSIDPGIHCN